MDTPKKKVLILTYYFPPSGGAGVQRILRMVEHLPQFGWEPVVLTVKNGDYPTKDPSLLDKIPHQTKVYRSFIPEPYRLYRKLTGRGAGEAVDLSTLSASVASKPSVPERVAAAIRSLFFIPDARIGWLPFAVFKGLQIIRREKIDLILSSAPPNSVHVIACVLKKLTGKKWVADFRDPWIKYLAPKRNAAFPEKLDRALGRKVVDRADHLIWVCKGVQQEVEATTGKKFSHKESILFNGFDETDYHGLSHRSSEKFTITYIGTLFVRYDFIKFIEAVEKLCASRSDFKDDFELIFCGAVDEQIRKRLEDSEFHANIQFLGYRSHKEALSLMVSSTLLLLYIIDSPEGRNIPTSKLFEYIGAMRPVLALAPQDSEAAEILTRTNSGMIVPPNDSAKIEAALLDPYEKWQQNGRLDLHLNAEAVQEFESKNLTQKLAKILDATVGH